MRSGSSRVEHVERDAGQVCRVSATLKKRRPPHIERASCLRLRIPDKQSRFTGDPVRSPGRPGLALAAPQANHIRDADSRSFRSSGLEHSDRNGRMDDGYSAHVHTLCDAQSGHSYNWHRPAHTSQGRKGRLPCHCARFRYSHRPVPELMQVWRLRKGPKPKGQSSRCAKKTLHFPAIYDWEQRHDTQPRSRQNLHEIGMEQMKRG
jgi:hypothetical protein